MSSIVIYIALRSISKYNKTKLFSTKIIKWSYVYSFGILWQVLKVLVPNKEIVVVIHHLEIFFVSIYSKTRFY